MPLPRDRIRTVLFDYGNTLIEFAANQIAAWDRAMIDYLQRAFGPLDVDRYLRISHTVRTEPYDHPEHRENGPEVVTRRMMETLYQRAPDEDELRALAEHRRRVFVDVVQAPPGVDDLLAELKARYRLGLVSNFPCGRSIRESLDRTGLAAYFDAVVVSGDVGYVKPHPAPFRAALEALDADPQRTVYIGDNWLGDVQGAKRLNMYAVHLCQYDTPEKFDPEPNDHDPDLVLHHLDGLREHL